MRTPPKRAQRPWRVKRSRPHRHCALCRLKPVGVHRGALFCNGEKKEGINSEDYSGLTVKWGDMKPRHMGFIRVEPETIHRVAFQRDSTYAN